MSGIPVINSWQNKQSSQENRPVAEFNRSVPPPPIPSSYGAAAPYPYTGTGAGYSNTLPHHATGIGWQFTNNEGGHQSSSSTKESYNQGAPPGQGSNSYNNYNFRPTENNWQSTQPWPVHQPHPINKDVCGRFV